MITNQDVASVIVGIVMIAALIAFFTISANIARLKRYVLQDRISHQKTEFYINQASGQKDKAATNLEYIIYWTLINITEKYQREKEYEKLKETYSKHFKVLNKPFPEYPYTKHF